MLNKVKRLFFAASIIVCAALPSGCGSPSDGNYYYVSNGVSLSENEAQKFERAFELSGSRLRETIDVPLDESAYTAYQKEWENEPFPEARVWSGDINSASASIDDASDDLAKRSEILNKSADGQEE